jgi:hypothetical protein
MTWIDITSVLFGLVTIFVVIRSTHEVKQLLSDARYERLDINRRLEKMSRRLEQVEGAEAEPEEEE